MSFGKVNKPIALTYSQRSIDRASSDAALNLLCAAKFASSDIAEIVLVGHENLEDKNCLAMPATKVRKMHTSRRDAFKVINDKPIARINEEYLHILKEVNLKSETLAKAEAKFSEKVALIKITPGQNPEILGYYKEKGYRGIILELAGLGQVPGNKAKYDWIKKIKKMTKEGLIIFGASQTINGAVNSKVYSSARETEKAGLIYLKDMLSETALVKLSWVLGHPGWFYKDDKVKEKMLEDRAKEFNQQRKFDFC
jgi:glutamyl-tRNA(Gln) amidotransferase subunit D